MTRDEDSWILCLGDDWGYQTSSHQQLMRELSRRHRILWLNSVGMRAPTLSVRDIRRLWDKGVKTPALTIQEGVHVASLPVLPFHGSSFARAINRHLIRRAVQRWQSTLGLCDPTIVCAIPAAVDVFTTVEARRRIYYCVDDYATLPGVDWEMVEPLEREVIAAADIIVVTSDVLRSLPRFANRHVSVLPHGVDYELFAQSRCSPAPDVLSRLGALSPPILGFAGLIDQRIDVDLIEYIADSNVGSIVIVGEVWVGRERLQRHPAIHMTGYVPHHEVPRYLAACDVLLAPYVRGEHTRALQPLKIREYLATGKPVVAIEVPALSALGEVVSLTATHEEFLRAVRSALLGGGASASARLALAERASWRHRAREFEDLAGLS